VGEITLWTEVLIHATRALVGKRGDPHALLRRYRRRSAREWFESERHDVGSFLWIADQIDIDGPSFRRRLFRLADHQIGHTLGEGRAEIFDPGASTRGVFGDVPSENEKAAVGPPSL